MQTIVAAIENLSSTKDHCLIAPEQYLVQRNTGIGFPKIPGPLAPKKNPDTLLHPDIFEKPTRL